MAPPRPARMAPRFRSRTRTSALPHSVKPTDSSGGGGMQAWLVNKSYTAEEHLRGKMFWGEYANTRPWYARETEFIGSVVHRGQVLSVGKTYLPALGSAEGLAGYRRT